MRGGVFWESGRGGYREIKKKVLGVFQGSKQDERMPVKTKRKKKKEKKKKGEK